MNELLPRVRRAFAAWGAPATTSLTSPRDFPQNEQRTPGAFIFAIMGGALPRCRAIHGARSLHLLNHIPWPGWQINIDRARHPARLFRYSGQCAWRESQMSAREYG